MRWISMLSVTCFSLAALAQAPVPAPAPAPRAKVSRPTGPSLGAGRDEDFDTLPPVASFDGALRTDDATLLRAIMWAYEPAPREVRVQAVEDLGLLGDARALNVLAHMLTDPDFAVQVAAVRAARLYRHPRAEEILINVVKHPTLPERVKLLALEGLLFQNTRGALVFLWSVGNNRGWCESLYGTARRLLLDVPKEAWSRPT